MGRRPRRPGAAPAARRAALEASLAGLAARLPAAAQAAGAVSRGAEWLLDNAHVIQGALRQAAEDLPEPFYRRLPLVLEGPFAGQLRLEAVARQVRAAAAGPLDLAGIRRAVDDLQSTTPLTIGELWALPALLRLQVVEDLVQAAGTLLAEAGPAGDEEAAARIAAGVLALRTLAAADWRLVFESVSHVERELRRDPGGVYTEMDFATRDSYRKQVEELSRGSGREEVEVAQAAVRLAEEAGQGRRRERHVGFYLVGEGQALLARQLGYRPRPGVRARRWASAYPTLVYLGAIAAATLAAMLPPLAWASLLGFSPPRLALLGALLLLPAGTAGTSVVNALLTLLLPPRVLPKMDFEEDLPDDCRTLVVVPALLTGAGEVRSLLRDLEIRFLGNAGRNLGFALLSDFGDAPCRRMPGDAELLRAATDGIAELERRHRRGDEPPRFFLLHRERRWNPAEGVWMGWERKRGKLAELGRLLAGAADTGFTTRVGDLPSFGPVRYVLTLDADTFLPRGAAARLAAAMAHPLNQAELDASGRVVAGYTVLQPRIAVDPATVRTRYARLLAGESGLDLYSRAVSDVYQDLFGIGIYAGKGLYDPAAFDRCLAGRVPDNALLSHDLFEGLHGRAGLVSDVVLLEDYPPNALAAMQRLHRWIRGDWQLLPWLLPRVPAAGGGRLPNPLPLVGRFMLFDNLRRSLFAPALLALLALGWLWLPRPWIWTLGAAVTVALPILLGGFTATWRIARGAALGASLADEASRLRIGLSQAAVTLALLPYEAAIAAGAVLRTLVRLGTGRRLLEWTSAAHAARGLGERPGAGAFWRSMAAAPALAAALSAMLAALAPAALPAALPLLLLWALSPGIAAGLARPPSRRREAVLAVADSRRLRRLARRTWHFYERFVGPGDHWLPPDNFQEEPGQVVAHRTSPTNVGMLLLSTLTAHDLGYLGTDSLAARLGSTLATLEDLDGHRGHLWNWYDTRSLAPLEPRYVSTVDSGNLAACLLVTAHGCREAAAAPAASPALCDGLIDTLSLLAEAVEEAGSAAPPELAAAIAADLERLRRRAGAAGDPAAWTALLAAVEEVWLPQIEGRIVALAEASSPPLDAHHIAELSIWSEQVRYHLQKMRRALARIAWIPLMARPPRLYARLEADAGASRDLARAWGELRAALPGSPRLSEVPAACARGEERLAVLAELVAAQSGPGAGEARAWNASLREALAGAAADTASLLDELDELADRAAARMEKMELGFLFDRDRQLFRIGYNASLGELDPNHYDLLASEARIASLLAIATGEVPPSHWLHLGRPLARVGTGRCLLSWGGTMFELLMPRLLMEHPESTLLGESCRVAVARQIDFAREHGIPWGISESGYAELDAQHNYRYRAFGVPGLALQRDPASRLVVAPYACLLALPVAPREVLANLRRLAGLEMVGRYGLFEAIDFGPAESASPRRPAVVHSYMAHHQGMILVALGNALCGEPAVRRFHADPRIATVAPLLHEQAPPRAPLREPPPAVSEAAAAPLRFEAAALGSWRVPAGDPRPQAHVLSNGRYSVLVTSWGGGGSRWNDRVLVRGQADAVLEPRGTWIYVEDLDTGELWRAGGEPAMQRVGEVHFAPHLAEIHYAHDGLGVRVAVAVSPTDDLEARLVRISDETGRPRRLALTSYGEVVLASSAEDRRHPAFGKLFVESARAAGNGALLFRRRPRSAAEDPLALAHAVVGDGKAETRWETDRARFLGRGGSYRRPAALAPGSPGLSGTTGATLDPIFALRRRIDLAPHGQAEVAFLTAAGPTRAAALAALDRHRSLPGVHEVFARARAHAGPELRDAGIPAGGARGAQELLSAILLPHPALRAEPAVLAANRLGQGGLWPHGISGDLPILLVRASDRTESSLVREVLAAHALWRRHRVEVDLVLLDTSATVYEQPLRDWLDREIARAGGAEQRDRPGGVFMVRSHLLPAADRTLLEAAAAAVLDASRGGLEAQLRPLREPGPSHGLPAFVPVASAPLAPEPTPPLPRPADLLFDNGLGGFSRDGRHYVVHLDPGRTTPAAWAGVVANPGFGFLASESGGGCTWAVNSAEGRLTPWRNDPVLDTPGEALYLRDEETGEVWTPTRLPAGGEAACQARFGAGAVVYRQHSRGLAQELELFVPLEAPVKIAVLRLANLWQRPRRITATFYAEWVLGTSRHATAAHVASEYDAASGALLARCSFPAGGERTAFLAADRAPHGLTADRAEMLGTPPDPVEPAGLRRIGLASAVGAGLDPCAALQLHFDLGPGETTEAHFLLGQGADRREALELVARFREHSAVAAARREVESFWEGLLGAVEVATPEPEIDLAANRWLLYQVLSCRLWGRTALYQASGAFGFRDQLQDVLALLAVRPAIAREHLLEAARHQFEEGDVLHWWHPPEDRGVRTRCSDDLLWLPYVAARYVEVTGDRSVLGEPVAFLAGPQLQHGEAERYDRYAPAEASATLYEHCLRAIRRGTTAGPHGLPLIGTGDWNDGMNRVGAEGRGESVWLAWFLHSVLTGFAPLCAAEGDAGEAAQLSHQAESLRRRIEDAAWDGDWYLRAWYDDGTPLGSAAGRECQIDLIAQAWAVLSGAADPARAARAMESAWGRLVRPEEGLTLLLAPPFDRERDPGYIRGYPPGIRENGGQYSHAAAWAAWAFARLGDGDRAAAVLRTLDPLYRTATPAAVERYRVEPFAVAADVAGIAPHAGRGGWTGYTGAAAWTWRLIVEAILGLRREAGVLTIDPCIPAAWPGFAATLREGGAVYRVRVDNPHGASRGVAEVRLDGEPLDEPRIPLVDDGREHAVQVRLGETSEAALPALQAARAG